MPHRTADGKIGQNVRCRSLDRLYASMIKQKEKKEQTAYGPAKPMNKQNPPSQHSNEPRNPMASDKYGLTRTSWQGWVTPEQRRIIIDRSHSHQERRKPASLIFAGEWFTRATMDRHKRWRTRDR